MTDATNAPDTESEKKMEHAMSDLRAALGWYERDERERLSKESCHAQVRDGCPVHGDRFIEARQRVRQGKADHVITGDDRTVLEREMLDRARGVRDDLRAMQAKLHERAYVWRDEAAATLDREEYVYRHGEANRLKGMREAYLMAANLIADLFGVAETRDDDPPDAAPIRLLDDDGEPLPVPQQHRYRASDPR